MTRAPAIGRPESASVTVPSRAPVGPLVQLGNLKEPTRVNSKNGDGTPMYSACTRTCSRPPGPRPSSCSRPRSRRASPGCSGPRRRRPRRPSSRARPRRGVPSPRPSGGSTRRTCVAQGHVAVLVHGDRAHEAIALVGHVGALLKDHRSAVGVAELEPPDRGPILAGRAVDREVRRRAIREYRSCGRPAGTSGGSDWRGSAGPTRPEGRSPRPGSRCRNPGRRRERSRRPPGR